VIFRIINGLMALLFLLAVAVQYNDPDPIRWMLLYGAAMVVAAVVAIRGHIPVMAPVAVCVVALAWGVYWAATSGTPFVLYEHMFDAWEMKNTAIEEAREASGLLIVAFWMAVIAVWSRRSLHV
jgi:hypothetical protein